MKNSELLLPVGSYPMCLAAIHNGADAIYVGMPYFNARGRTQDFGFDELKNIIDTCHLYGVKVHIAFNVLIFESELSSVIKLLIKAIELGPDAFIVQDLGLVSLIKSIAPEQVVHASTQMTISNFESIELLEDLDIERFVLARECSLKEIKSIREKTEKELEVFVHGALCVSYSGQCFTSEALGGRSANRGQCAQSCRFDYKLIVDGKIKNMVDQKYFVSPKDLCGIEHVKDLQEIGVESFKVEGRLKSPEYVASCAKNYSDVIKGDIKNIVNKTEEMGKTFSRGFYSGWLEGVEHQKLVDGRFGNHRGIELGDVLKVNKNVIKVKTKSDIRPGVGILVTDNNSEVGGIVFDVKKSEKSLELKLDKKAMVSKIKPGMRVYLNKDSETEKELKKSYTDKDLQKKIHLKLSVAGKLNQNLIVRANDGLNTFTIESESLLEQASKHALNEKSLLKDLGSLGHTCFKLTNLEVKVEKGLYLSQKELKNLKNGIVKGLYHLRTQVENIVVNTRPELPIERNNKKVLPKLNILLRTKQQLNDFLNYYSKCNLKEFIGNIILDYEFGQEYEQSVSLAQQNGINVFIATTRILKPYEYHNLRQILRVNPNGFLVRNLGALNFLQKNCDLPIKGDFSLNITNSITGNYLLEKGLSTICPGNDLNIKQLNDLVKNSEASKIEVIIHQYMPEFHMEHCVFAAFLSNGSSFKDCGKPCEEHKVELVDMYGNNHYLKADQECRNTMFLATPQSAASFIPELIEQGVGEFRIEALFEDKDELISKIDTYLRVMSGLDNIEKTLNQLNVIEKYGVSSGQLSHSDDYKDNKKRHKK